MRSGRGIREIVCNIQRNIRACMPDAAQRHKPNQFLQNLAGGPPATFPCRALSPSTLTSRLVLRRGPVVGAKLSRCHCSRTRNSTATYRHHLRMVGADCCVSSRNRCAVLIEAANCECPLLARMTRRLGGGGSGVGVEPTCPAHCRNDAN